MAEPLPDWLMPAGGLTAADLDRLPGPQRAFHYLVRELADAEANRATTWYPAEAVLLAVEVVSPESEARDRERKPQLYARSGIPHFWRVEETPDEEPVFHIFELDRATGAYSLSGIHHDRLTLTQPFPIDVRLDLSAV